MLMSNERDLSEASENEKILEKNANKCIMFYIYFPQNHLLSTPCAEARNTLKAAHFGGKKIIARPEMDF